MGRKPRIHYPGAFYPVINRGNQRCKLFWNSDDYQRTLERLEHASTRYQLLVHSFLPFRQSGEFSPADPFGCDTQPPENAGALEANSPTGHSDEKASTGTVGFQLFKSGTLLLLQQNQVRNVFLDGRGE